MTIKLNRHERNTLNEHVVDPWDNQTKENIYGVYYHLVQELELDSERFHRYFLMTREQLGDILFQIEPLPDY